MEFKNTVVGIFEIVTISRDWEHHLDETFRGDLGPEIYCVPNEKTNVNHVEGHFD